MAEEEELQQQQQQDKIEEEKKMSFSLSIWPPTQRTREAVINRLIENLSSPSSILAKRYGSIPQEEASSIALQIEEEAFSTTSLSDKASSASDADGIETLHTYSSEISKRMLAAVKARAAPTDTAPTTPAPATATATSEEVSSRESESP